MEYSIDKSLKICSVCEREIGEGERFHSAVFEEDEVFVRRDYCAGCWGEPPEGSFSHWRTCNAVKKEEKRRLDAEIVLGFFRELGSKKAENELNFRYVIGLLLMRKRILKFDDIERTGREEFLVLRRPSTKEKHRVLVRTLTDEEIAALTEEVGRLLAASTVVDEEEG